MKIFFTIKNEFNLVLILVVNFFATQILIGMVLLFGWYKLIIWRGWQAKLELDWCYSSRYSIQRNARLNAVKLGFNVMNRTEYFASLKTSVVLIDLWNVMVKSEELIDTMKYLTL